MLRCRKDLSVDLPIFIAHPLSLPVAAEQSRRAHIPRSPQQYHPVDPATYSHHPHPQQHPYHTAGYTPALLPSPSLPTLTQFSSTPISPTNYFNPQHFPPPLPPTSPAYFNHSPGVGGGYVAFDPQQADYTPSRLFAQPLPYQQSQQIVPSSLSMVDQEQQRGMPSRRHSSGENYRAPDLIYQNYPLPPPSTSPARLSPSSSSTNDRPLSAKAFREVDQPLQPQQPIPDSTSNFSLLPPNQGPSAPQMIRSVSAGSLSRSPSQLARTPPPPAPSARFHSPSPSFSLPASSSIDELSVIDDGLLETIGEDSESAAGGTAKNTSFDVDFLELLKGLDVERRGRGAWRKS